MNNSKTTPALAAPKSLQQFQHNYGRYLRDPKSHPRPNGIPKRRSQVYEELLFNNVCSFIDKCFPVAKSMVPEKKWRRLCRIFYRDWRCDDPIFSTIPFEFVQFINQSEITLPLPAWFAELLHYEWTELEVDMDPACENPFSYGDYAPSVIAVNGTLRVLNYQWPVHKICPNYRPRKPQQFCSLVFRNLHLQVKFIEVNPMTAYLVQAIQNANGDNKIALLNALATQLKWPVAAEFIDFGCKIIQDLSQQEALFEAQ